MDFKEALQRVRKMAEDRLAKGENADEFVEIGEADGFKLYVAAGKTLKRKFPRSFHENPRDVFILVLVGEIEFAFENGEKKIVRKNQCLVLPKHTKHECIFKKMTIVFEGVHEKGLAN